ncbi:hypothetical protein RFI_24078, partial [Reticulomyxa filosa]
MDSPEVLSDGHISKAYIEALNRYKIFGYQDWICIGIEHDIFNVHLTNIVLHRRYLFYQYSNSEEKKIAPESKDKSKSTHLLYPVPLYSGPLYNRFEKHGGKQSDKTNASDKKPGTTSMAISLSSLVYESDNAKEKELQAKADKQDHEHDEKQNSEMCHGISYSAVSKLPLEKLKHFEIIPDFGVYSNEEIYQLEIMPMDQQ